MFDTGTRINRYGEIEINCTDEFQEQRIVAIAKALSHPLRVKMINQILREPRSIIDLAKLNKINNSTVIFHLKLLEEAELVTSRARPNIKGKTLIFYINFAHIHIAMQTPIPKTKENTVEQSMRVGNYISAKAESYIRIATDDEFVVMEVDDIYNPKRFEANLLCMDNGEVTYAFSNAFSKRVKAVRLEFSLEISSESPYYCNDWKSEIFFCICGIEVATFLSLGDYGGVRGLLNPDWWDNKYSQNGVLTTIAIDNAGVYVNGKKIRDDITIETLELERQDRILFSFRTDQSSQYAGGFNVYGKTFGNEPQDIVLKAFISDDK